MPRDTTSRMYHIHFVRRKGAGAGVSRNCREALRREKSENGQAFIRMKRDVRLGPAASSGLFLFRFGLFFQLFRPGGLLAAAAPGDEGDQASKKEDWRDTSKDELLRRAPTDDDTPDS